MKVFRVKRTQKVYQFEGDQGWHWGHTKGYEKTVHGLMLVVDVNGLEDPGIEVAILDIHTDSVAYLDQYWPLLDVDGVAGTTAIIIGLEPCPIKSATELAQSGKPTTRPSTF